MQAQAVVLTERERYVLEQRYGRWGKPRSQNDIGIEFGVSKTLIQQIEMGALIKMRSPYHRIKQLQEFLPRALSRGKDDFYARLFIKLFKLKPEHILNILQTLATH